LIYRFLHFTLRFWLRIHFRRIFLANESEIPAKGPVILACNHPNSFLDAIVIALLIKRPIHFLARSDVFRKPLARWILGQMHLIPIYRLQEGSENLEKNKGTFKRCSEILAKGEVLLIFSEGNCVLEKRLRPLKKGTARIAFTAEESFGWKLNIRIIPVGINYTHPTLFRTELMVSFGKGFFTSEFRPIWQMEPVKGIRAFNDRLTLGLTDELLIIPQKELDKEAEAALELNRTFFHYPIFKHKFRKEKRLKLEQHLLRRLWGDTNIPSENHFHTFELASKHAGISLKSAIPYVYKYGTAYLLIGFIPAIIGVLIHLAPLTFTRFITNKTVKDPKFKSSVMFGTGAILTYLWYLISAAVFSTFGFKYVIITGVFPFLAFISLIWLELIQQRRNRFQFMIFQRSAPKVFNAWKAERDELLMALQETEEIQ
jgi:glycerol-3-phosphate O-acyltransferase/dihydroxyacetone phosphate acyltransferase